MSDRNKDFNISNTQNIFGSHCTKKKKFSIKDFFIKCDQIRRILQIWSHLLNTFSMENLIFCAMPETIHHKLILQCYEKIALLHDGSFQH